MVCDPEHEHGTQHDRSMRQGPRCRLLVLLPLIDHTRYIGLRTVKTSRLVPTVVQPAHR